VRQAAEGMRADGRPAHSHDRLLRRWRGLKETEVVASPASEPAYFVYYGDITILSVSTKSA